VGSIAGKQGLPLLAKHWCKLSMQAAVLERLYRSGRLLEHLRYKENGMFIPAAAK
jgi:hypothetical protein